MKHHLGPFLRSALVGVVATLVDWTSLWMMVQFLGVDKLTANVPSLLLGVSVQYVGNKYFAFRDHRPVHARQLGLFTLVELGTLLLNAVSYDLLVRFDLLDYRLARPVGTFVVYVTFSYPLWRLVFRTPTRT